MENHTVMEEFFIVDLTDMEVILGIKWMETLDQYTQSFKQMDFTFMVDKKNLALWGMANDGLKEFLVHQMEAILWHNDIA